MNSNYLYITAREWFMLAFNYFGKSTFSFSATDLRMWNIFRHLQRQNRGSDDSEDERLLKNHFEVFPKKEMHFSYFWGKTLLWEKFQGNPFTYPNCTGPLLQRLSLK